jgi:hypothetical protein
MRSESVVTDWRSDLPSTSRKARRRLSREALLGSVLLGAVLLVLGYYADEHYPLIGPGPPVLLGVSLTLCFLALAVLFWQRRRLFPWSYSARDLLGAPLLFTAIAALALPIVLFTFVNGALDRSNPRVVDTTVVNKFMRGTKIPSCYFELAHTSGATRSPITLEMPRSDCNTTPIRTRIVLEIRAGFFGYPWVRRAD